MKKEILKNFILPTFLILTAYTGLKYSDTKNEIQNFPNDFLFGVAISGFQNEPGCPTIPEEICTDQNSDWAAFINDQQIQQNAVLFVNGESLSNGPGYWELYDQDFSLARDLHLKTFRISLEWSRIFPNSTVGIEGYENLKKVADKEALAHYHRILNSMRNHGLKPLITVHHYTLPLWIHDGVGCHKSLATCKAKGWLDREHIVPEITKYSSFVAKEFGSKTDLWITQNEPMAVVISGYLFQNQERSNPPGLSFHFNEAKTSMANMIEAHAAMYKAIKSADTFDADDDGNPAEIGLAYAITPVRPKNPESEIDRQGAKNLSYLYNDVFLQAIIKGEADFDLDGVTEYKQGLAKTADFIGINYYYPLHISGSTFPNLPHLSKLTTFNIWEFIFNYEEVWQEDPKGLYEAIMMVEQWGLPSYITENGTVIPNNGEDPDNEVSVFLVQSLQWLAQALKEGADVRGYYFWTLTDNYEWNRGMNDIRMGLFAVNKNDPFKIRKARKNIISTYKTIVENYAIPPEFKEKFGKIEL